MRHSGRIRSKKLLFNSYNATPFLRLTDVSGLQSAVTHRKAVCRSRGAASHARRGRRCGRASPDGFPLRYPVLTIRARR